MPHWSRVLHEQTPYLAQPEGTGRLRLYQGDLWEGPVDTGKLVDADSVTWLPPVEPS